MGARTWSSDVSGVRRGARRMQNCALPGRRQNGHAQENLERCLVKSPGRLERDPVRTGGGAGAMTGETAAAWIVRNRDGRVRTIAAADREYRALRRRQRRGDREGGQSSLDRDRISSDQRGASTQSCEHRRKDSRGGKPRSIWAELNKRTLP